MTNDDRRRQYHQLLDQHDAAFQAFREASTAFDQAMDGMAEVMRGIRRANEAQGEAIEAMMAANREARARCSMRSARAPRRRRPGS